MSLECSVCERDVRGGHDPGCTRPDIVANRFATVKALVAQIEATHMSVVPLRDLKEAMGLIDDPCPPEPFEGNPCVLFGRDHAIHHDGRGHSWGHGAVLIHPGHQE